MLDDQNIIKQRDPEGAITIIADSHKQTIFDATVWNGEHDQRELTRVVVAGMGGSALAALLANAWLKSELTVPFEVVRGYDLPAYVDDHTLVIASSYSGNTEETLSCLQQAEKRGSQIAILAAGGKLIDEANAYSIANVTLPDHIQPRMALIDNLRGLMALLVNFGVVEQRKYDEIAGLSGWLEQETQNWLPSVPSEKNYAKQIALEAVGKTPVFFGGALTGPLAYKWKISWNESSKNLAFYNEYPEFNHNEFIGWTAHPVEKPFVIFDLISSFEHPQILKRFEISDRLLSGKRPKANVINLAGDSVIAQLLWGCVLADFASCYTAVLNNVDPTPVALVEQLKKEL